MRKKKYKIEIWKEKESNLYVIECKKLKVVTQGKTFKEAFERIADAIQLREEK